VGRDCPFCKARIITSGHYPLCDKFKPLWNLISRILQIDVDSSLKFAFGGCKDSTGNVFIFYGLCTIYKTYVHCLNNFDNNFDFLAHFRHLVFGRLLSEYQVCMHSGRVFLQNFHRKWMKFKIYKIVNNKICINLS